MDHFKVGMATCSKAYFFSGAALSYLVRGKVVIVLDRRSVDTGQIIGVLCEDDVACPSLLEQNWAMLAEGSWVRHPKMRGARIRLRRDGWVAVRHESYGDLLSAFPSGRVRALFEEDGFAKVPPARLPQRRAPPAGGGGEEAGEGAGEEGGEGGRGGAAPAAAAETPAAPAAAGAAPPPAAPAAAAPPPEEPLRRHLGACGAEHWEALHGAVHLREHFRRGARLLRTLRQGSVLCLGAGPPASPDGRWARCGPGAKLWPAAEAPRPEPLLGDAFAEGYLLKEHDDHANLRRIDPPPKPKPKPRRGPEGPDDPGFEFKRRIATEDFWTVLHSDLGIHDERSEASAAQFWLGKGDVIFTSGEEEHTLWQEPSRQWLLVPAGAQVFRDAQHLHSVEWRGFVAVEADGVERAQRGREPEASSVVRALSGYGEPWAVVRDRAAVYPEPSSAREPLAGFLLEGDVVGVRARAGAWAELAGDSDLRLPAAGAAGAAAGAPRVAGARDASMVTELRAAGGGPGGEGGGWAGAGAGAAGGGEVRRVVRGDPSRRAWVMTDDPAGGQLLRRCPAPDGSLHARRVLSDERRERYREVLELCHRRIYSENLSGLWDGDSTKLPTLESMEEKLLDRTSMVIHVAKRNKFCGGAVIKELSVKAKHSNSTADEGSGCVSICYIDMCAAQPGSHAGCDIWEFLVSAKYACIACHPILLQSTVDFWQGRGMRRFDPSSEKDTDEFRRQVLTHTGGMIVELTDVQECLPASKLPLFVFVSALFVQPRARLSGLM